MQPVASTSAIPAQIPGVLQPAVSAATSLPAAAPQTGQADLTESEVNSAIRAANAALKQVTNDLEFARDKETGKIVVRIIDASTHQIIRQFPSDEMLAIARALDRFEGFLLKEKA